MGKKKGKKKIVGTKGFRQYKKNVVALAKLVVNHPMGMRLWDSYVPTGMMYNGRGYCNPKMGSAFVFEKLTNASGKEDSDSILDFLNSPVRPILSTTEDVMTVLDYIMCIAEDIVIIEGVRDAAAMGVGKIFKDRIETMEETLEESSFSRISDISDCLKLSYLDFPTGECRDLCNLIEDINSFHKNELWVDEDMFDPKHNFRWALYDLANVFSLPSDVRIALLTEEEMELIEDFRKNRSKDESVSEEAVEHPDPIEIPELNEVEIGD